MYQRATMSHIQPFEIDLYGRSFGVLIAADQIQERVADLASQIRSDYAGRQLVVLCVLNGAFRFAADLCSHLNDSTEVVFTKVHSYEGMLSSGLVQEQLPVSSQLAGKHVLIVEDIVDTGTTLKFVMERVYQQAPASVRVATLLFKPDALLKPLQLDYVGFEIPNRFVVGYGLDYDGQGRCLNALYVLKEE